MNNDKVDARFAVPLPGPPMCLHCKYPLEDCTAATRHWLRPGEAILGLVPQNEEAEEMLRVSHILAKHGASGRPACSSIAFGSGRCAGCRILFEGACTAVARGSALSREDSTEALSLSGRMADAAVAKHLRAKRGCPLSAGAVRSAHRAERGRTAPHNAKIPVRMGDEPHHSSDESMMNGSDGVGGAGGGASGGGAGPTILERTTRLSASRRLHVLGACTKSLVYLRFRISRSKAALAETYEKFVHVPATADGTRGSRAQTSGTT